MTPRPTPSRAPVQVAFQQAGLPFPFELNYTAPNFTLPGPASRVLDASSWRGTSTVEFSEAYAMSLAYVPIILVMLFVVFVVTVVALACVTWCKGCQQNPDGCCTPKSTRCATPCQCQCRVILTKHQARILFTAFLVGAWILYLASFIWSFQLYSNENSFVQSVDDFYHIFYRVNRSSTILNMNLGTISYLLAEQPTYCPVSGSPPDGVSEQQWQTFQSQVGSLFSYMSTGVTTLMQFVEGGPMKGAPAMMNAISEFQTTSHNIIVARTAIVGVLLGIMLLAIPSMVVMDWACTSFLYRTRDGCKRTCVKCNNTFVTCMAVFVVLLMTIMVGLLFSLLFFTADMCNPDPLIFLGRVGGLATKTPTVSAPPPAGITLGKWCANVLAPLSDPFDIPDNPVLNPEYEGSTSSPTTFPPPPPAPITSTLFCYYGTCEIMHAKSADVRRLKEFVTKLWMPLILLSNGLNRAVPLIPCTKFVDQLVNSTRAALVDTIYMMAGVSCAQVNPIVVSLFYNSVCDSYIYFESVLTAMVLSGNVLFTIGVLIAVAYDLAIDSKEEFEEKERKGSWKRDKEEGDPSTREPQAQEQADQAAAGGKTLVQV